MTNLSMEEAKAILEEHDVSRRDALKAGALAVAGSAAMSGSAAAQTGDEPLIELAEGSTDPSANGEITRNGADIKAYSGGSVKTLNDALDGSQGADGEVWTSTGSAAQWEAASGGGSNVPDWTEDGNSPVTASGDSNISLTLNGTYDQVKLVLHDITGDNGALRDLALEVNGQTGGVYNQRQTDGSTSNGRNNWSIGRTTPSSGNVGGTVFISGRWTTFPTFSGPIGSEEQPFGLYGRIKTAANEASPLDSLTLRWGTGTISGKIEAFGRDVA